MAIAKLAPHVMVKAGAGTGKTTTIVSGLFHAKGLPVSITPSTQQRAIWDEIAKSRDAKSIRFCAFNKSIATELQNRVPSGVEACTTHSLGFKLVRDAFGSRVRVSQYRISNILCEILKGEYKQLWQEKFVVMSATEKLVNLCKQTLTTDFSPESLDEITNYYDIELADNNSSNRSEVYSLVPQVIERCKLVKKDNEIDFTDMVWLPVALNLPAKPVDLLLVDEFQDVNRCQQELAKKCGRRLVCVGDEKQAIYAFAGADSESMKRLEQELSATPAGCVVLPLNETRRCGKAIVAEANKIVPDFYAHSSNPEGTVTYSTFTDNGYRAEIAEGDMALCRVNAPLIQECFRFLKLGRKANIQGRDVGQGLISLIKKQKADDITQLVAKLSEWLEKETLKERAKKRPNENKIITMQDKVDCICIFTEGCDSIRCVIDKIEGIFTDDHNTKCIKFSSIHKAKGLESDNVFLLEPKGATMPHPLAKTPQAVEQEFNLLYVAITRAIHKLVRVK